MGLNLTVHGVVELVPGSLQVLGGSVPRDGSVSWAPGSGGRLAVNAYLLITSVGYMLIDPGPYVLGPQVVAQLKRVLPAGSELDIFLTRAELDCSSSLSHIVEAFGVRRLLAGGIRNPFDQFDSIGWARDQGEFVPMARQAKGSGLELGDGRQLVVIQPPLRLLATYWLYDTGSGSLFTSDIFSHGAGADDATARTPDRVGEASDDDVRQHLLGKYWWLKYAQTASLRTYLTETFSAHEVTNICPGQGRVIAGSNAVESSVRQLIRVLERLEAERPAELDASFALPSVTSL